MRATAVARPLFRLRVTNLRQPESDALEKAIQEIFENVLEKQPRMTAVSPVVGDGSGFVTLNPRMRRLAEIIERDDT